MSEVPFNPNNMNALFRKGRIEFATQQAMPEVQEAPKVELPEEGKIVERDGKWYRWERVPSGASVMNPETWQKEPHYHTLRTWFNHTIQVEPGGEWVNGPGWDALRRLPDYSTQEMLEKYGHIFTDDEMRNPYGDEDPETGEITGGMPDTPFLWLEPIDKEEQE